MTPRPWMLTGAAMLVAITVAGGVVALSTANPTTAAVRQAPNTVTVVKGNLSATVFQYGTLTYQALPDGSPYAVINQARGAYTALPEDGTKVGCGDVLYRVIDKPVLLLCGATPAYRSLSAGARGRDVAQLNANLVDLGYVTRAQLGPSADAFTFATTYALERLQAKLGEDQTGSLELGQAVFLPGPLRIGKAVAILGTIARPGALVLQAMSTRRLVEVQLDPAQQSSVAVGARARIILPNNRSTPGRITRIGTVATSSGSASNPPGSGSASSTPTIPIDITLDHPGAAGGLDQAPVRVQITTAGVTGALVVPVTALVGKAGGFAVDVVGVAGRRRLVTVRPGLFDDADGLVQVNGDPRAGDHVVVPSS